ncbi:MAG: iron-sulfur cluster assembly scaffold protein [Planctomycetes bacterium]|nr:iron-sulfur cluster assembly scaffold protein [Planctomycetota bacterium]
MLEHFWRPKNNHVDPEADVMGVAGVPGNGPFMVLYLRLEGQIVRQASFQTHGCAPSIAAGSLLATELPGVQVLEAPGRWPEEAINAALGDLPFHKRHCSALAAEALARASEAARRRTQAPAPEHAALDDQGERGAT